MNEARRPLALSEENCARHNAGSAEIQVERVSRDLAPFLADKLAKFQALSVNRCTRSSLKRTNRLSDIDVYYTTSPMKL